MPPDPRTSSLRFEPIPPEAGAPAGALLLCDEAGLLRFASEGVRQLLGCPPDSLMGRSVRTLAAEAGLSEGIVSGLAASLRDGGSGRVSLLVGGPDDETPRALEVSVQAMPAREGTGREFVALLADVTARRSAERALAEVRRVLKPGGEFRFWEHVRAHGWVGATAQDAITPLWRRLGGGCHPNRDTRAAIERAGFEFLHIREVKLGPLPAIVGAARPVSHDEAKSERP